MVKTGERVLQGQRCCQSYGLTRVCDPNMGHGPDPQMLGFCLCIARGPSPPRLPPYVSLAVLQADTPDLLAKGSEF